MAPLTFGIELECHVATLAYGEEDPEPRDPRQVYDLTMQIIGSRVHELRYVQRQVAKKLQKETGGMLHSKSIQVQGISMLDVHKMCTTISQSFRVTSNQTCGFHVHVGNGIGENEKRFPFSAMRNLLAIIWTFEHQIASLHPEHRLSNKFCVRMHTESAICRGTTRQGLGKIFATRDLDELRQLTLTNGTRSAYNLMRVDGSLAFVTKLVEVAVRDMENPRGMLWKEVDREEKQAPASVYQFMRTFLDCPDVAEYYAKRDNVGDTPNILPES
ncbi:hypothetical protein GLAREA_09295 [Glarea lozoyensis ATCC 20868]|uniref:Amidoligase enzyme n=1 Tax=Glarea lozoyensis (strain ATCC 20868 / MF5171) TaxID=1116229 RepID=S3DFD2_GLAL2|nr:uncharacterized protein GLAREA_09295 [Glarea lozoyensis ATCC 20868]EPE37132.1 hypothetical protein GLAREA_09295 [Glarea lozoyensis ATCC 20868]